MRRKRRRVFVMMKEEDAYEKQRAAFEKSLDASAWVVTVTTAVYLDWLGTTRAGHVAKINKAAEDTGRVPVTELKNFLALAQEQGWLADVMTIHAVLGE